MPTNARSVLQLVVCCNTLNAAQQVEYYIWRFILLTFLLKCINRSP